MSLKLYRTPLPKDALQAVEPSIQRQLSQSGLLGGGSSVTNVAGEPADLTLSGNYRGKYAELLGTELRELLNSDLTLPLYDEGGDQLAEAGYYATQRGSSARVNPRSDRLATFDADLVQSDTRASAWRAVETNPSQPSPGNDFGNGTSAEIGIPAAAEKVRWYDAETRAVAEAAIQTTRSAEYGELDIVDAQAAPYADPTCIYDLPYAAAGDVDVSVWDDYGRGKRDADDVVAWQRVFDPSHDYRGACVLDTGLLRVHADETAQSLTAETWDRNAQDWTDEPLGASDWRLYDWDVRRIGMVETRVLAEFADSTQSPTAYYPLEGILTRGSETVQWLRTANEDAPVPAGLQDLLAPIAGQSVVVPTASSALIPRTEVR